MTEVGLVSVVTPTRDRTDVLPWSLQTVIEQEYPNLVILVSDNGDTDSARNIAETAHCERVRYIRPGPVQRTPVTVLQVAP
jgi:GalNAc5-diNAcBac-PP-undecaprenol beta-1,3-glucosyltransferase